MNPDNPFATVAQAVINLVTLHSHLFVGIGQHLFRGFAVILIAWFGIKAALAASEGRGPFPMAKFASLLMTIAFGYAMVTYYSTPIPGFGVSFTHLITDQAHEPRPATRGLAGPGDRHPPHRVVPDDGAAVAPQHARPGPLLPDRLRR